MLLVLVWSMKAGVHNRQADDYFLLGFAEAWLNGALVTLMVIYVPRWVGSFDDRRYLLNK